MKNMLFAVALLSFIAFGCIEVLISSPTSTPPSFHTPDYIRSLIAHREGDALMISFSLGDIDGSPTIAPGRVSIQIFRIGQTREFDIYHKTFLVTKEDFDDLHYCHLGRLKYDQFDWSIGKGDQGRLELTFTTYDGRNLSDDTRFSF